MSLTITDPGALLALGRALQAAGYQFTTVTPATHARVNARPGSERAHDLRDVFGWSRPFEKDALAREVLELMERAGVLRVRGQLMHSSVRAATLAGRLYFHSAYPSDAADAVFFGPDTCRFVAAIDRACAALDRPPARAVDLGCGAGAGAIHIARRFPPTEVIGADVNPDALVLAGVNARLAGAVNVATCRSDLFASLTGDFDLVVANPPYVCDPEGRTYRDGGGEHGLAVSLAMLEGGLQRLRPGGTLLLYTGVAIEQGRDRLLATVEPRLEAAGVRWSYEELDPDVFGEELCQPQYARAERIAVVCLHVY
jgi:methylase of polypeptide subunit release factors